jgi:Helix-turn-helix domain
MLDQMLAGLDGTLRWSDGQLLIKKSCCEATVNLGERELLFVPSAFAWPQAIVIHDSAWQPTIIYPARGAGTLWQRAEPIRPPILAALIGSRRAAILLALDEPRSTVDLAKSVGLSPGGVSQHLTVMRNASLLDKRRVRREVLYWRSPAGDSLLAAAAPAG